MPRLREDTRLTRRQALIDAAWRCAAATGFREMTIDEVSAAAGHTKGAFYAHFESKRELLYALVDDDARALDEVMASLDQASIPPVERIRRFTHSLIERGDDAARVRVRAGLWATVLNDPTVRTQVNRPGQRQRTILRGWIEAAIVDGSVAAVPANALASILLALGDGLMVHHALDSAAFRWSNVALALDALIGGGRKPATAP